MASVAIDSAQSFGLAAEGGGVQFESLGQDLFVSWVRSMAPRANSNQPGEELLSRTRPSAAASANTLAQLSPELVTGMMPTHLAYVAALAAMRTRIGLRLQALKGPSACGVV